VTRPVLVTGASGFVGGHLLEHMAQPDVVAWTRSTFLADGRDAVRWQRMDLLDRDAVRAAIRALKPREIYHCAGVTHVARSWENPVQPLAGNLLATHYLLDALRRAGEPCRVLVTGSASVYAPSDTVLTEDSPLAPDSPYAVTKMAQEALALRAVVEDGVDVIVTRSFNHTGPRQTDAFDTPAIARQIEGIERGGHEPVISAGYLDSRRDLTDVRDVVRAYVELMRAGIPGQVYNVASGTSHTIRSVIETLAALAGVHVRIDIDPSRLRPSDKPVLAGDAGKIHALTGWAPRISFETMLKDLLDYWRTAAAREESSNI
jgi:GDP-4-dehydro-6-deoxy-D-mannose reductase